MSDDPKGFWHSIPGVLTGLAAVLTAATGLYLAVKGQGAAPPAEPPAPVATPAALAPVQAPVQPAPAPAVAPPAADRFVLSAEISDPDGFTNVRDARSTAGRVVARVVSGEAFNTYPQNGDWWEVRTADGRVGFMHASRIKPVLQGH